MNNIPLVFRLPNSHHLPIKQFLLSYLLTRLSSGLSLSNALDLSKSVIGYSYLSSILDYQIQTLLLAYVFSSDQDWFSILIPAEEDDNRFKDCFKEFFTLRVALTLFLSFAVDFACLPMSVASIDDTKIRLSVWTLLQRNRKRIIYQ